MPAKGLVNKGMGVILFKGVYKMGKSHRKTGSRWLSLYKQVPDA